MRSQFVEGITPSELIELFRADRDSDYDELTEEINELKEAVLVAEKAGDAWASGMVSRAARLRQRLTEIQGIDFFSAPADRPAEMLLAEIEAKIRRLGMSSEFHAANDLVRFGIQKRQCSRTVSNHDPTAV